MSSIPAKDWKSVWELLTCGIRDYVRKNGFTDVVLGLSGGMDSALVAALAVDALGKDHVHGVMMPSPWSSEGSITDSEALAANLGMSRFLSVSSHWANVAITAMVLFIGLAVFSVVMSASVDFLSPMVGDAEWLDTVVAIVLYVLMVAGIYGLFAKFNDAK